jgi:hypothetical protein
MLNLLLEGAERINAPNPAVTSTFDALFHVTPVIFIGHLPFACGTNAAML